MDPRYQRDTLAVFVAGLLAFCLIACSAMRARLDADSFEFELYDAIPCIECAPDVASCPHIQAGIQTNF